MKVCEDWYGALPEIEKKCMMFGNTRGVPILSSSLSRDKDSM
jgi:hypothetical protein